MKTSRVLLLIVCVFGFVCVRCHDGLYDDDDDDDEDYDYNKKEAVNALHQEKFVQNKEHAQEHLDNKANINLKDAAPQEVEFHFFSSHDANGDQKLDGLELFHSVEHGSLTQMDHIHQNAHFDASTKQKKTDMIYERITRTVDRILDEDDINDDGYLTYPEFAKARIAGRALRAVAAS